MLDESHPLTIQCNRNSIPTISTMKTRIIRHISAAVAICALVTSCIQVDNVENAWESSKADPDLLGAWEGDNNALCAFVKTDKDYFVTSGTNGLEGGCKTFDANGSKFIIVASLKSSVLGFDKVEVDGKSGTLLRYEVRGNKLTMYSLDGKVLKEAIQAKEAKGTIKDDSPKLAELDEATIRWLSKAAKGKGWTENVYRRSK